MMIKSYPNLRTASCWLLVLSAACSLPGSVLGQAVCLPAPRLLTTMPMGGQVGTEVEVTITGQNLEAADKLVFSDPRIAATPKLDAAGKPEPNKFVVKIAAECPPAIYEARVMTRMGLSSSRAFSVGDLPELVQSGKNTSLTTAMEVKVNSLTNAVMTTRAVDHFTFTATKGQRLLVECASRGIDSKLNAVLIVADATGRDLLVERQGGVLDFTAPEDGKYVIKVHELTYNGGPEHFYRLAVRELPAGAPIVKMPSTRTVNSFSWPPEGLPEQAAATESEPNNSGSQVQKISLPCDIAGSFFPAADVDVFEFEAKKGDVWWVEVASERFGLPTDPAILVQHVSGAGETVTLTDVAELSDIPSPVKVSSNGYAYDGPPYNAGTADILGKLEIKQDGVHRLQISDLFGGTRNDPKNVYRLVIRKAAPDFAVVAWALHMELRNGDRNALSKPIALRGGATMALEVVAIRRDGFDGDIELAMEGLPPGVKAQGLKIPAGKSRGIMLVTAEQDAPQGFASANFFGRAEINGATVVRPCRLATMAWPVTDAWGEIPYPRLLADVPVSVGTAEQAPLSLAAAQPEVLEAIAGTKLTIPLTHIRRSEFSGATMSLKVFGAGFEGAPSITVPLTADTSEVVFDLAALKTPPGDYQIALYGPAVVKYVDPPPAAAASDAAAPNQLKKTSAAASSKDIVDIIVSEPIAIRVKPAESK